jgi:uncharacterized YigZ family protein
MSYAIPAEEIRREMSVSNSRFIATLAPIGSTEEARDFIGRVRQEFKGATHNVPAYILGGDRSVNEYCSDDGEPSGTAGRPILAVLRGSGLGDVCVVVTRYFGGKLLGKGGLVRAYTEAAQLVARDVPRANRIQVHEVTLILSYPFLERLRSLVGRFHGEIIEEIFTDRVTVKLRLPVDQWDGFQAALSELSAGSLQGKVTETREVLVRITG